MRLLQFGVRLLQFGFSALSGSGLAGTCGKVARGEARHLAPNMRYGCEL